MPPGFLGKFTKQTQCITRCPKVRRVVMTPFTLWRCQYIVVVRTTAFQHLRTEKSTRLTFDEHVINPANLMGVMKSGIGGLNQSYAVYFNLMEDPCQMSL